MLQSFHLPAQFSHMLWYLRGADQGGIEPATPPLREPARKPRDNFQRPFESSESKKIRAAPQRERFDTHDLRRRFAEVKTSSHGATARALRHARSPQRVRRGQDNSHGATARALARSPQRVSRGQDKFARRHSESASTRTISAGGYVS